MSTTSSTTNVTFIEHFQDDFPRVSKFTAEFDVDLTDESSGSIVEINRLGTLSISETKFNAVEYEHIVETDSFTTNDLGFELTLTDFSYKLSRNEDINEDSVEFNGTMTDALLGEFGFKTETPLSGIIVTQLSTDAGRFYSEGEFSVRQGNVTVTITAQNATDVHLSMDTNNDGEPDFQEDTTWANLEAAYLDFVEFFFPIPQ